MIRSVIRCATMELHHEPSGYRHYLDGEPVHAGAILEIRREQEWLRGRYEWCFQPDREPYLVFPDDSAVLIREADEVRWPDETFDRG